MNLRKKNLLTAFSVLAIASSASAAVIVGSSFTTTTTTAYDLNSIFESPAISGESSLYITISIDTDYDTIVDQNGFDLVQIYNSTGQQIVGIGESGGGNTTWNLAGFLSGGILDTSDNPDLNLVFRIDQLAEDVFLYINPDLSDLESNNTVATSYTDVAGFGATTNDIQRVRLIGNNSDNTHAYSDIAMYTGDDTPFAVPEPSNAMLIGLAGFLVLTLRRRR